MNLTIGDFATLLNQIEAVLNSRLLTSVSNDAYDALALTAEHFPNGKTLPEITVFTVESATTLTRQKKKMKTSS